MTRTSATATHPTAAVYRRRRARGRRWPSSPATSAADARRPWRPDRSRRRPCLRRRDRDGTARPGRCGPSPATACGRWPSATTATVDAGPLRRRAHRPQRRHRHRRRPARAAAMTRGVGSSVRGVHCPVCRADDTKVVDSRLAEEGAAVRRRRHCLSCGHRFTTFERIDEVPLVVTKSDGRTRAVRPRQDRRRHRRRHQGPRRRPQRHRADRRGRRGRRPAAGLGGLQRPGRPRRARPAAHARRGRLPALRQRVQELRRRRRLPPRDRAAHEAASRGEPTSRTSGASSG